MEEEHSKFLARIQEAHREEVTRLQGEKQDVETELAGKTSECEELQQLVARINTDENIVKHAAPSLKRQVSWKAENHERCGAASRGRRQRGARPTVDLPSFIFFLSLFSFPFSLTLSLLISWLSMPHEDGLKKRGWVQLFAVLQQTGMVLFRTETDRTSANIALNLSTDVLHSATPVRQEDLLHAKASDIPRVFQVGMRVGPS